MTSITQRVAQLVEDHTRFTAAHIATLQAQQDHQSPVHIQTHTTLQYRVEAAQGAGALPDGVKRYPDAQQAAAAATQQLQRAQDEAPQLLKKWVQGEGQTYRRYLTPQAGFLTAPHTVGTQQACAQCQGQGRTTCGSCNGRRRSTCSNCSGSGECNCRTCQGTGSRNCDRCSGTAYVACHTCNGGSLAMGGAYTGGGQSGCGSCGGAGKRLCISCNFGTLGCACGNGKVRCNGCNGSGACTCGRCSGTGLCKCQPCSGTGSHHATWDVVCEVDNQSQTLLDDAIPSALQSSVKVLATALGTAQPGPHPTQVKALSCAVQHTYDVAWSHAQIGIHDRSYQLYGLGPTAEVHDYQNIVGDLLHADLTALRTAAQRATLFSALHASLGEQLQDFAKSEMNLRIVDALTDGSATDSLTRSTGGAVSADYVQAAQHAVTDSLARLLHPRMLKTMGWLLLWALLLSTGITLWAVYARESLYLLPLFFALTTAAAGWIGAEWWQRRQLTQLFAPATRPRIAAFLRRHPATRQWRVTAACLLALAAVAGSWGTQQLPFVQRVQTELADLDSQYPRIQNWLQARTWTYETYPDADWLQRHSASSTPQQPAIAMAHASWLLLHGDRSAAQARAALDLVPPAERHGWQWDTIHALVDMASADPAAQTAGLQRLHTAADAGSPEAQWHLSQHYQRSDPAKAVAYLEWAAERTQHEAMLALGQRYLKGQGVAQDLQRAQQLLGGLIFSPVPGGREAATASAQALMHNGADAALKKQQR